MDLWRPSTSSSYPWEIPLIKSTSPTVDSIYIAPAGERSVDPWLRVVRCAKIIRMPLIHDPFPYVADEVANSLWRMTKSLATYR
jgi:hypothetical protein